MKKEKNLRKRLLTVFFILFNAGVILWTALKEFSGGKDAEQFKNVHINWLFLLPAAGCFVFAITCEVIKWSITMKSTSQKVNRKAALQSILLGRYYDNITPSGVGGQPFQIYHLGQNGFTASQSSVITLSCFIATQFAFIIIALLCFTFGFGFRMEFDGIFRISGYIGLFFFSSVPIAILVFAFFPNAASKIVTFFVKLFHKLKFIKNGEAAVQKAEKTMSEYSVYLKDMLKRPAFCFKLIFLSLLYQIARCSIPFFVVYAFGGRVNFLNSFITTVSIYMAITYIPTPGNSGVAEGSFYAMFSDITSGYLFWAMLTWRFFTFYIYIIYGLLYYLKRTVKSKLNSRNGN